jgi:hypothetical protein
MLNWRKILYSGVIVSTLTFSSLSASAVSFDDVGGLESEASISKLVSLGVMVNSGSSFNPDSALKRIEFAEIANKILALPSSSSFKIKDVNTTNGKNKSVNKIVKSGILKVNKNNEFKPNNGVTYAEFSKALAQGLGFKAHWSDSAIDYLYYLERKGILDIDTDLDAVVTKEAAALAIDKYMAFNSPYSTDKGVVVEVKEKGFTLNNGSENVYYSYSANASVFVSGQSVTTADVQVGSPATVVLNSKGQAAFYSGELLDAEENTIKLSNAKWTIGALTKEVNLDAFVKSLPNKPEEEFSIKLIDMYSKAGAQFAGQVFFTNMDEVTAIYPYIAKVEGKGITVKDNSLTVSISSTINETFTINDEVKVTLNEKEATVADLVAAQTAGETITATIEAEKFGSVTVITATSAPKK